MFVRSRALKSTGNLTSKTNAANAAEALRKWGAKDGSRKPGIPQISRMDASKIPIIHETPRILIAGRNRCNNFNGNQYCIIAKATKQAMLIDMCDDWPDDWHYFLEASDVSLKCIAFTHLHVDNLLGLPAFMHLRPETIVAWNYAELYWAERFGRACERYKRQDLLGCHLPFNKGDLLGPGSRQIILTADNNRLAPSVDLQLAPDVAILPVYSPGHSMGHTMFHLPQERLLFTGDMLFHGAIGRVDVPNGSGRLMAQSLRQLEDFPDQTVVLPGHGRITTLGRERKANPGLRRVYEAIAAGDEDPCVGFNVGFL